MKNLIQIAGIKDREEAELLLECGVDLLGFPLRIASHDEDLSENAAAEIIRELNLCKHAVCITYLDEARSIAALSNKLDVSIVQIHREITAGELQQLKMLAPNLRLVKSLIVRPDNLSDLISQVGAFDSHVDGFIIDTYDPSTGACGATGKTHDWMTSRALADVSSKPVILAGGLTAENVRRAIMEVKPAGVDSHTGVEDANGRKSRSLVETFVMEAREGFAAI